MLVPHSCPTCGDAIPADAPHDLCPKCLLGGAFAVGAPNQTVDDSVTSDMAGGVHRRQEQRPHPIPPIAGYQIIRLLGQGGMGIVYEAEQEFPRRRVALKLVRAGVTGETTLRRFAYEADVLGRLDHPGIARIYQAGVAETPQGPQPFFAMELVDGLPLNHWIKQHEASTRRRLEMIAEICEAANHAHTKGVIHRDLKPSNVVVTDDGRPKILDFGVARATDVDLQSTTLHTEPGQVIGTLPYMAPEQAAGQADSLDTSSDVYGLGVIAYELLTGRLPYAIKGKSIPEIVLAICEEEPDRLSSIDRTLRGDVDTIVHKALAKDRARRYQTAGEFAADVRRHLDCQPIVARPPSASYQLSRFARRNRVLVGSLATVLLILVGGGVTSLLFGLDARRQKFEAQAQRQEAEAQKVEAQTQKLEAQTQQKRAEQQVAIVRAVNSFMDRTFTAVDPGRMMGENVTVLQAINQAAKELEQGALKDQPVLEAAVRTSIGKTLRKLSRYEEAEPHLRKALDQRRQTLPADDPALVESLSELSSVLYDRGNYKEAESLGREALDRLRATSGVSREDLASAARNLGWTLYGQGRTREAENLYREALQLSRSPKTLNALAVLLQSGRRSGAAPLYREALDATRRERPAGHPEIARAMSNYAMVLYASGHFGEAVAHQREALAIYRAAMPEGHREIAKAAYNLARVLTDMRKPEEAERLHREALEIYRKVLPAGHVEIARSLNSIGTLLHSQGKLADAETMQRESLKIWRAAYPPGHTEPAYAMFSLASVLKDEGEFAEAEQLFREALEIRRKSLPVGDWERYRTLTRLLLVLHARGSFTIEKARALEPDSYVLATSFFAMGAALSNQGKPTEGDVYVRHAAEILRDPRGAPPKSPSLLNSLAWKLCVRRDVDARDFALATALAQQGVELAPKDGNLLNTLGLARYRTGDFPGAVSALERAVEFHKGSLPLDFLFLAMAHQRLGNPTAAKDSFQKANQLASRSATPGDDWNRFINEAKDVLGLARPTTQDTTNWSIPTLQAMNTEAWKLRRDNHLEESAALREQVVAAAKRLLPPNDKRLYTYQGGYAEVLTQLKRFPEAETQFLDAIATLKASPSGATEDLTWVMGRIAAMYKASGQPEKAADYERKIVAATQATTLPATNPTPRSR